jgi:hypothetical protein
MRKGISDEGLTKLAGVLPKQAASGDDIAYDLAEKLVGNWQKFESFGWGGRPDENPENWTIVYTSNRDSGLLDKANEKVIEEIMGQFPEDQVVAERHGHWAVGHVDGYSIRVYEPDGSLTPAFKAWAEIQASLESYPILDEHIYSEMEWEAAVENCKYAVPSRLNNYPNERVQDHWNEVMDDDAAAASFMDWARDNDPNDMQSSDDQGYYPRDNVIDEWIEEVIVPKMPPPEPGDEDYEEPDPGAEGFATGPNPVDPRQMALPFKGGRRRAQAVPPLPVEDEEELNPDELEEVQPQREKFNWNDYIWGPFRKQKPARRYTSQMSTQDDAIVRMVTQEDARLVKYRGGLALVPVDGYAYPVDQSGAELALAHGAEDWTNPQERMKTGGREALVEIYKGVSDRGLERIARRLRAQSDPGVGFTGPLPGDEELDEAEAYGEAEERGEKIPPEKVLEKVKNLWDEDTLEHLVSAEGWADDDGWSIEAQVFVPREEMQDFLQFSEAPSMEEWTDTLYEAYDDQPGVEGNPGRWAHTCSVSSVIEESNGIRFTLTYSAFMDI